MKTLQHFVDTNIRERSRQFS